MYVAGEAPGFQSRMPALKLQIVDMARFFAPLPDLDVVFQQEDMPEITRINTRCPKRGPMLVATKDPLDSVHEHAILAPDFAFGGAGHNFRSLHASVF